MGNPHTARRVFVGLVLTSLVLLAFLVSPFLKPFLFAAVLAGALWPAQQRLSRRLCERRGLAAGLLITTVLVVLVVPVGGTAAFVVAQATEGVRWVSRTLRSEGMEGLAQRLPAPVRGMGQRLLERFSVQEAHLTELLQEHLGTQGGSAVQAAADVLSATGSFLFEAVMMLIALYFLLVDGPALVAWLERVSPLQQGQVTELLQEFRQVSGAVLVSSVATAGVQALAALAGYLVARVPAPFFFAVLTFFIAFVPAVGATGVCLAAALLIWATGHPVAALFLAAWGLGVVGLVDNVVKPLIVKRGLQLHGAIIFFALLGGLAAFGAVGLVIGPLIVAFFLALVRMHERDYGTPPVPSPPSPPT
jgi:predicted PurR-regulated permease PerM